MFQLLVLLFIIKLYARSNLFLRVFEIFTHKVCKMFVYKHTETMEYVIK